VSGESICAKKLWVDPLPVVPDLQPKLPPVIADVNFDAAGSCVPEGVSQGLACNSIDFIPRDWKKILRRAFHFKMKGWGITVGSIGSQRFPK
jgi:hypothetical protein